MNQAVQNTKWNKRVDEIEVALSSLPPVDCPLKHTLTENQYIREIFMPAGTGIISQIHLTEHPYFVLAGRAIVWTENEGKVEIQAPYSGITKPNTRRILYIEEDCLWATVHTRLENETIDEIADRILDKHDNPELPQEFKNIMLEIADLHSRKKLVTN